jgi:hypothetical protein
MLVGQAYPHALTLRQQKALQASCDILIDSIFDELQDVETPKDIANTTLGSYLPERFLYKYTPLFLRKFAVCIITVAWKLAQPTHFPLSSIAEELAAWTIIEHAKVVLETEELAAQTSIKQATTIPETKKNTEAVEDDFEEDTEAIEDNFETFIDIYFEDLDFQYLYDDFYDGIDEAPIAQVLGMSSLAFNQWFEPFSNDPSRTPHPYTTEETSSTNR